MKLKDGVAEENETTPSKRLKLSTEDGSCPIEQTLKDGSILSIEFSSSQSYTIYSWGYLLGIEYGQRSLCNLI